MKKAALILALVLFSLLYYGGVLTPKGTLPFSRDFFSVETASPADGTVDLKAAWAARTSGAGASPVLDSKGFEALYQMKLDQGVPNLPTFSLLLLREADQARQKGRPDQAVDLIRWAMKFSPDLPQPPLALCGALWDQNPFQLKKIVVSWFRGQLARFRYFPTAVPLAYNLFFIVANAAMMAFMVTAVVLLIRYAPLFFLEIRRNLSQELDRLLDSSLKIFLSFLPLFLRLDLVWAILFWLVLIWGYVNRPERRFIVAFLIVIVYVPFFLRTSAALLDDPVSEVIMDLHQANHGEPDRAASGRLRAWLVFHPDDSETLFSLGLVEKRNGQYLAAEEDYKRAIQHDKGMAGAWSNLGNVYLARRQGETAIAAYDQAVRLDPDNWISYYNLSRAYSQESFLSFRIEGAMKKARQLDPGRFDAQTAIDSSNYNRLVVDETLSPGRLWSRFLSEFAGREGTLFRLFKAWFEKIPSRLPMAPIVLLVFLTGMSRYCRTRRFLTRCPVCGTSTYRFYLGASDHEFICFNCYRIFVQAERLHPRITEKKSIQAREFRMENYRTSRLLSFFLPGFSDLWHGRLVKATAVLFVWFLLIVGWVNWNGVVPLPFETATPLPWARVLWAGLSVLFYLLCVWPVYRMSPPEEERKELRKGDAAQVS
jgi:tetratricopeptide (TPR) repeat protein